MTTCENSDASWKIGKPVVELDTLAESLSAWCACQEPISLLNTEESRDFGLPCVLHKQCSNCGAINNVATGRNNCRVYAMNAKLAWVRLFCVFGTLVHYIGKALNTPNRQNVTNSTKVQITKSLSFKMYKPIYTVVCVFYINIRIQSTRHHKLLFKEIL